VLNPVALAEPADIFGLGAGFCAQLMIHSHGNQPRWMLERGHVIPEKKKQPERIAAARHSSNHGPGLPKPEWLEQFENIAWAKPHEITPQSKHANKIMLKQKSGAVGDST
jgi:hypothetical protein